MDKTFIFKRGMALEYVTIGWNATATIVAISAGIAAGSIALTAFGLNSVMETVLVVLLVWRFRAETTTQKTKDEYTAAERKALFVVGVVFFLLALYILNESGTKFYYKMKPEGSAAGLVLSVLALIAAPVLAFMKFRTANALESRVLRADAVRTAVCVYISLILFLGLGLHAWKGWWWADPVAALFMIPLIVRKGWKAVEESKGNPYESGAAKTGP